MIRLLPFLFLAMIDKIKKGWNKLNIKPVSVAAKCRLQFGGAVILIIFLALLIPYYWMGKLTENAAIDAGKNLMTLLKFYHFQSFDIDQKSLVNLDDNGMITDVNNSPLRWIRCSNDNIEPGNLNKEQVSVINELIKEPEHSERSWFSYDKGLPVSNYISVVRAEDSCLSCHRLDGTASAFNLDEPIGVMVVKMPARQITRTKLLNNIMVIVAGVLAGTGALIAFYVIAQRIILRPIRQLRALVNNVSEGNLNARSSIKTQDEYQKLSDAFNAMLDGLEHSQEKLRQANAQLDTKIAELSERNIELYKANKLKSEFLANMSHEFRTPLNAILGFAEILKEKSEIEKNKRYAENITTSGRNLLNMINDLLDLAKAEAGKMTVRFENVSVPDLCRYMVSFFTPMADNKKIGIDSEFADDIPVIQTDPMKLQQILFNFMSNAIKFTKEGGEITLKVSMPDEKHIRIEVVDTGIGISEKDSETIFEKFRQLDSTLTKKTPGSGLGLAICKELTTLLSGKIGVHSILDKGSTFWVELPIRIKQEQADNE